MKTFRQTLIGTFQDVNNEGSAKRATAAWFALVLLSSSVGVYVHAVYVAVHQSQPTAIDIKVLDIYMDVTWSLLITLLILLGLTSVEFVVNAITKLISIIRGGENKKEDK
jgi:hypothetical protein